MNLEKQIIQQYSNFFNAYTKGFNKMYDRKGKLFLTPFYRKVVAHPRQFLNTWKHIYYNPVRHQFTQDPYGWHHSIIHDYRQNNDHRIFISNARVLAESTFGFNSARDWKPDWNDFTEFDY